MAFTDAAHQLEGAEGVVALTAELPHNLRALGFDRLLNGPGAAAHEDPEANEEVSADGEISEDPEASEEVSAGGEIPEDTEAGESESQDETAEDPEADAYDGSVGKKEADQAGNGRSTALYGNLKWEKVKANRGVLLSDRSDSGMKSAANRKKSLLETAHR